jgi:hypothetical protein
MVLLVISGCLAYVRHDKVRRTYAANPDIGGALKGLNRRRTRRENVEVPGGPGHHQHRSVRVPDDEWDDAGEATAEMGTDRAKIINQFLRWWLRRPGAELPERPRRP